MIDDRPLLCMCFARRRVPTAALPCLVNVRCIAIGTPVDHAVPLPFLVGGTLAGIASVSHKGSPAFGTARHQKHPAIMTF